MKDLLGEICRKFAVSSLYAFGSRAQEARSRVLGQERIERRSGADLDIAVQPAPGVYLTAMEKVKLVVLLEDLFQVPRVDLVVLPEADLFLAAEAVKGELLYCEDEDRQAEEELYYLSRAGDLAPLERARIRGILVGELWR